ncbi:MAG: flagellar hook-associated protein FlgL, partial [Nitrospinota bacterium]
MVLRVTASQRFSVALRNILTGLQRVQAVQEQIVTGKAILRPSDDPAGFSKVTSLRGLIQESLQFRKNIDNSKGTLNVTDQTLSSIRSLVQEARTLAIAQAGAPADATTRAATATQIARIRESVIQLANTQVGGRYIFAGTSVFTRPYDAAGAYHGDSEGVAINLGVANPSTLNVTGSEFLTTDLNPDLFRLAAYSKGTAPVTDRYRIDTAGGDANNAIAIKSSPSGTTLPITFAADMAAPAAGLATAELNAAGGGLVVGRQYAYAVSAVDSTGESIHSAPVTRTVTAGNNAINFSFNAVPGAVSYRIYRLDDTEYAATGAAGLEGTDFEQQDSLIGTVNETGLAGYTFLDTGQAQQAGQRALGTASATRTFSGTALAGIVQLRVNNRVKEVTTANRSIRIVEDGGLRSDTITISTGLKTGFALAAELQTAINASTALKGSTSAVPPGAGYTVTYDPFTDKFTVASGSPVNETSIDPAQGALAGLMGFTSSTASGPSATSDATATGVEVTYDAAKDIFTFRAAGTAPDKIQVISAATNAASTAAGILGFSVDSAQTAEVSSNVKTAFNILSGQNDAFSVQVDGGTNTSITALADMVAPAAGLATAELNAAGGGLVVGRQYAYAVSAVDSTGESIHSAPVTRTVTAGNNAINFSFNAVPGAVSYRIYRLDDTEYAATGAAGLEGTDFEQQDSLIGTVNETGLAGYTFLDTGQAQQAGQRALGTASATRTFSGTALAGIVQLRVNNRVKEVTTANRSIRIVEDGGLRSDTITISTGLKTGFALAAELQTAINASTALKGSTSAVPPGAGYTVTY